MAYREEFDDRHEPPHTHPSIELKEGERRFVTALSALFDGIFYSGGGLYPDLVIVDNARLMDEKSLEFFCGYLASAEHKPFVVLCDRAPNSRASRVFGVDERLVLEPLSQTDAEELVRSLLNLDGAALDDEAEELLSWDERDDYLERARAGDGTQAQRHLFTLAVFLGVEETLDLLARRLFERLLLDVDAADTAECREPSVHFLTDALEHGAGVFDAVGDRRLELLQDLGL